MIDDNDPVLAAVAALRAAGIKAIPTGHDMELWQIGDLIYSDDDLWRLAASHAPASERWRAAIASRQEALSTSSTS